MVVSKSNRSETADICENPFTVIGIVIVPPGHEVAEPAVVTGAFWPNKMIGNKMLNATSMLIIDFDFIFMIKGVIICTVEAGLGQN